MTDPREARERALTAAAEAGAAPAPGPEASELERAIAPGRPSIEMLQDWAVLRVDPKLIRSTRRMGGALTMVKRALVRFLRQYNYEVEARQTRFNLAVVARLGELEQGSEVERPAGDGPRRPAGDDPRRPAGDAPRRP